VPGISGDVGLDGVWPGFVDDDRIMLETESLRPRDVRVDEDIWCDDQPVTLTKLRQVLVTAIQR
jgi:hypothetical protein